MKHVGLITSYAAADCGVQSVEVWERRIVEVQACSESRLVHAAGDSDTPGGGREGGGGGRGWRGVCAGRGGLAGLLVWERQCESVPVRRSPTLPFSIHPPLRHTHTQPLPPLSTVNAPCHWLPLGANEEAGGSAEQNGGRLICSPRRTARRRQAAGRGKEPALPALSDRWWRANSV